MSGFTSGPWKTDVFAAMVRSADDKHHICDIRGFGCTDEECAANARLIAAAPELLEALQQCLQHIELDESMHGRPFGAGNVAREAIKKATGE